MGLSESQMVTILQAKNILDQAGLSTADLTFSSDPDYRRLADILTIVTPPQPSPAVQGSQYEPPAAQPFSDDDIRKNKNKINRQTSANFFIDHPVGAIVEYPQTASVIGKRIAHRFSINPADFFHPKSNFQYSLGDKHGGHDNVYCYFLRNENGELAKCSHLKTSCMLHFF